MVQIRPSLSIIEPRKPPIIITDDQAQIRPRNGQACKVEAAELSITSLSAHQKSKRKVAFCRQGCASCRAEPRFPRDLIMPSSNDRALRRGHFARPRAASERLSCRRGSIEGEPKCRLYEKGAPFGAPLIQAISTLAPPQIIDRTRSAAETFRTGRRCAVMCGQIRTLPRMARTRKTAKST